MKHTPQQLFVGSALAATLLSCAIAYAAENAKIAITTELKSAPDATASTVLTLAAGSSIQVGERKGAWYKVNSTNGEGWVRMVNVRLGEAHTQNTSLISNIAAIDQASRTETTVATGIRGLTSEDLKTAQDNQIELEKLRLFQIAESEALLFGKNANLILPNGGQ